MKIEYKPARDLQISVVDNHIVRRYMEHIESGIAVHPVQVIGSRVKDGNHRAAAYKLLGLNVPTIPYVGGTARRSSEHGEVEALSPTPFI